MNAQNIDNKPVVKRESKNKIRVEFDRTPLKERLKAKFLSFNFLSKVVVWIFRMVLMVGISYIVLFPYISQVFDSVKASSDLVDSTVGLIPKNFSLDIYRALIEEGAYLSRLVDTFTLSITCAVIQTFICCLIGYGFAKFKFKGRNLLFMLVMLTMIVPHQTIRQSMVDGFRFFDIFGFVRLFKGGGIQLFGHNIMELGEGVADFFENLNLLPDQIQWGKYLDGRGIEKWTVDMAVTQDGIDLTDTYFPLVILSLSGLAFKNGLYIFLLRQFFRGIPDELEESAYMDGSGPFRTFLQIILPLSIPMMITVFMFSFCWQWTDEFYTTNLLGTVAKESLLPSLVSFEPSILLSSVSSSHHFAYLPAIHNTAGLMIIFPLVILYSFFQRYLVQGIEQSGLAN